MPEILIAPEETFVQRRTNWTAFEKGDMLHDASGAHFEITEASEVNDDGIQTVTIEKINTEPDQPQS